MPGKPVVLIIRPGYWSDHFVTLFDEEGYETQDVVDPGTLEIKLVKQKAPYGVIIFGSMLHELVSVLSSAGEETGLARNLRAVVIFDPPSGAPPELPVGIPTIVHFASTQAAEAINNVDSVRSFVYPDTDTGFANEKSDAFDKPAFRMAYTRTLKLLRDQLGPDFDLEKIWDEHCAYKFAIRDVAKTMATMVPQPYVNHVPTLTGGVGYDEVSKFYKKHFIHSNPPDMTFVPVSRTIGIDRIVDELIVSFTHTTPIDWMLPGVPPTGKKVKIPLVALVCIRGGKLYHEHIYWDQASVLVQLGLLEPGKLPVAGAATAEKITDEASVKSNQMIKNWKQ